MTDPDKEKAAFFGMRWENVESSESHRAQQASKTLHEWVAGQMQNSHGFTGAERLFDAYRQGQQAALTQGSIAKAWNDAMGIRHD